MADKRTHLPTQSSNGEIDAFLSKVAVTVPGPGDGARGRLLFALDATASREPTWDRACHIQAQMFQEAASLGGLDMQVCFYRGFGEFKATGWTRDSKSLLQKMTRVRCVGGRTQVRRMLRHIRSETEKQKVTAAVFVGDTLEEPVDAVCDEAGHLGLTGTPVFMFHEIGNISARYAFQQVAKLTGGAYCALDASSAGRLAELLRAVAVYAAGGRRALVEFGDRHGGMVKQLTHQVR